MKKSILFLVPFLALGLAACQTSDKSNSNNDNSSGDNTPTLTPGTNTDPGTDPNSGTDPNQGTDPNSGTNPNPTVVTYTITTTNENWFGTEGIPVFAHYWDGENPGEWAVVNYTVGSLSATFDIPAEQNAIGFLVVRCAAGTALEDGKYPNWATAGDAPGRIYNKTKDNINIVENVTSYELPQMEDYNPAP